MVPFDWHDCSVPTSLDIVLKQWSLRNREKGRVLTLFCMQTLGEMLHKDYFWFSLKISGSKRQACIDINVFI